MTRLIDADNLKKLKVYSEERREYIVPVYNIDNAPTVEPKKGKKKANIAAEHDDNIAPFVCSRCWSGVESRDNFCWYCGADMREEPDNEDNSH